MVSQTRRPLQLVSQVSSVALFRDTAMTTVTARLRPRQDPSCNVGRPTSGLIHSDRYGDGPTRL